MNIKYKNIDEFKVALKKLNPNVEIIGEYINLETKTKFICLKNNIEFNKTPSNVLKGGCCEKCAKEKIIALIPSTQEEFIKKVKEKYNDDYIVLDNYVNNKHKILVRHKCGAEFKVQPNRLLSVDVKCFCQGGKMFKSDVNSVSITHPHLLNIFVDKTVPYNYSAGSEFKTDFICSQCGSIIKNKSICSVTTKELSCPTCSDGFSYPEKVMFNVLKQLGCDFEFHKRFNWAEGKEYDFYIINKEFNIIIEVHGLQHYEDCGWKSKDHNLELEQQNDNIKHNFAKINNIDYYIVIDARYSDIEWIKKSINTSILKDLYNLNMIDWDNCLKSSLKSKMIEVSELWNNGVTNYDELCYLTKLSLSTIQKYLKILAKSGLCDYKNKTKKSVKCITTGELFESIADARKLYNFSHISDCCNGLRKYCGIDKISGKKLQWEYV